MTAPAIQVRGLGKRFRIGARQEPYKRLTETMTDLALAPLRRLRRLGKPVPEDEEIWALKDVSFDIMPGEVVGVIGRNGAGKSTLLKILSRITEPTTGEAIIRGRVGSLLEVGTGFHPELTGRENIFLNGAILGMRRDEIRKKFDEMVAFAEIDRFIDTPVKRYSSGMYVRLAFAVAAHLETEILLVDEVLAVGDAVFQKKCLGKMENSTQDGRTVIFVSHNQQATQALCPRTILLANGSLDLFADTPQVLHRYRTSIFSERFSEESGLGDHRQRRGNGGCRFSSIRVSDEHGAVRTHFEAGSKVIFDLTARCFKDLPELLVSVNLRSSFTGEFVTAMVHRVTKAAVSSGTALNFQVECDTRDLAPGDYPLFFKLVDSYNRPFDVVDSLTPSLTISEPDSSSSPAADHALPVEGMVRLPSTFNLLSVERERSLG